MNTVDKPCALRYEYIFFDLDGTLTDPKEGLARAVIYSLGKLGIIENELSKIDRFIGPPLVVSYMEYYDLSRADAEKAVEYYREVYSVSGVYENRLYDGIALLLQKLQAAGAKLFVATSKPDKFANIVLEHFQIRNYFSDVSAVTASQSEKPKSQLITDMFLKHQIKDKSKAIMVGDRKFDIEAAKIAGIDSIGVLFGYGSRAELVEAGADYIAQDAQQILDILCAKEDVCEK